MNKSVLCIVLCVAFGVRLNAMDYKIGKRGAPVDTQTVNKWLWLAVHEGSSDWVSVLLEAGAKVNGLNKSGGTLLHSASRRGNMKIIAQLCTCAKYMLLEVDNKGRTPLHKAVLSGGLEAVQCLIACGSPYNVCDAQGCTPEELSSQEVVKDYLNNIDKLFDSVCSDMFLDCMKKFFLYTIIPIDVRASNGQTLLHRACHHGAEKNVQVLLENGASVHVRDFGGRTPLFLAVEAGSLGCVKQLVNHGALDLLSESDQEELIKTAVYKGFCEVVDFLLSHNVGWGLLVENQELFFSADEKALSPTDKGIYGTGSKPFGSQLRLFALLYGKIKSKDLAKEIIFHALAKSEQWIKEYVLEVTQLLHYADTRNFAGVMTLLKQDSILSTVWDDKLKQWVEWELVINMDTI